MRTLAKYVLFSFAAVALAWAAVSLELDGRTPYGHFLAAGGDSWVKGARASWRSAMSAAEGQIDGWTDGSKAAEAEPDRARRPKKTKPPARARPDPRPTVQEQSGAERRVALLGEARKQVEPKPKAHAKTRTQRDEPTTKADRAALDRLVAGR